MDVEAYFLMVYNYLAFVKKILSLKSNYIANGRKYNISNTALRATSKEFWI